MEKFFTNTLTQKYINNLLLNTEVPQIDFVNSGDFVVKDCCYIYNAQIIRCNKTGYLESNADYEFLELYLPWHKYVKYTDTFTNRDGYYTSEVHKKLGDYLRALKHNERINLMPMYNCFNYFTAENLIVKDGAIEEVVARDESVSNKTFLIPIKFNQQYTISIESGSQFNIAPIMYYDNRLANVYIGGGVVDVTNVYLKNIKTISYSQFEKPFLFEIKLEDISNDDDILKAIYDRQNCLYLMIQMSVANTSSIVVLEGNYLGKTSIGGEIIYDGELTEEAMDEIYAYKPQLQTYNTNQYTPYSDNLIQYLLASAIFNDRENEYNVKYVRGALGLDARGTYDEKVRKMVFDKALNSLYTDKIDIYGYVDSNVEKVILK